MSTGTALTTGWAPTEVTPILPVAPGLAKKYMQLFVNRLAYCEQSQYGDHSYFRPKHPELRALSGRKAASEMPGVKWGSEAHRDRADEIYFDLVKERNLESPYMWLSEQVIEQHLAGQVTVNLFAINPKNQCCKWIAIDADYETKKAEEDLSKLRGELLNLGVHAVQEHSRRGGHLWIFCAEPLLARKCRIFIYNHALSLGVPIKASGFDHEGIEIFPKQDAIESDGLGNALRAPLCIHRKDNKRYWFQGDFAECTLEAQIEALCTVPKLTAEQLNDLTFNMPPPPQWETPVVVPRKVYVGNGQLRRPPFNIYDNSTAPHRRKRASRLSHFRQCPSCAIKGSDRHQDNLEVGDSDKEKAGWYKCHAGCETDDIRVSCGYPPRDPQFRKR